MTDQERAVLAQEQAEPVSTAAAMRDARLNAGWGSSQEQTEPEQEPVGTVRVDAGEVHIVPVIRDADRSALKDGQSVYTAPPQRKFVPLTVEEIERIWRDGGGVGRPSIGLIRAIEQALKEQNR